MKPRTHFMKDAYLIMIMVLTAIHTTGASECPSYNNHRIFIPVPWTDFGHCDAIADIIDVSQCSLKTFDDEYMGFYYNHKLSQCIQCDVDDPLSPMNSSGSASVLYLKYKEIATDLTPDIKYFTELSRLVSLNATIADGSEMLSITTSFQGTFGSATIRIPFNAEKTESGTLVISYSHDKPSLTAQSLGSSPIRPGYEFFMVIRLFQLNPLSKEQNMRVFINTRLFLEGDFEPEYMFSFAAIKFDEGLSVSHLSF